LKRRNNPFLLKRILGLLLVILIGLVLYAFLVEPYSVKVEKIVVETEKIPKGLKLKIVQLSDLHLHGIGNRERLALSVIERLNPDIVVVTGDLIDNKENLDELYEFMKKLSQKEKTYVVFGNWDHWSGADLNDLKHELESLGVTVLINSHGKIEMDGACLYIVGVDDPHTGRANLEKALAGITSDCFVILLAHSPEIVMEAAERDVHLVLAGHTHGGQVVVPGYGPLFLPVSREYRKYSSGFFKIENTLLYVNRGLGTTMLPVRIFCPPEVTLIEIVGR